MYVKPFRDLINILAIGLYKIEKKIFLSSNEKPFEVRFWPRR
jgi:hypothetical protein